MTPEQDGTLGIRNLIGFGWIDPFMKWPAFVRLPCLTLLAAIVLFVPSFLGAPFRESLALFITMIMAGAILAVLVILARGAQADLRRRRRYERERHPGVVEGRSGSHRRNAGSG